MYVVSPSCFTDTLEVRPESDDEQFSESDADTDMVAVLDDDFPPFAGTYRYAAVDGVIDVILVPDEFRISAPDMPDTDTVNDRELSVYVVEP